MFRWDHAQVHELPLSTLKDRLQRYRLISPHAEQEMRRSLQEHGQLTPLVVGRWAGEPELIDGFKRVAAARAEGMAVLAARYIDVDEQKAKIAMYRLNCVGGRPNELEEAWLVHALVREDGLMQTEVALHLGRHKSWVSRRLALIERLCHPAQEDLRLGQLTLGKAREMIRLPMGNQEMLLATLHRESLCRDEVHQAVNLLEKERDPEAQWFVLSHPREAIARSTSSTKQHPDPRLSSAGNRLMQKVRLLESLLPDTETVLRNRGPLAVTPEDHSHLQPALTRVAAFARSLTQAVQEVFGA